MNRKHLLIALLAITAFLCSVLSFGARNLVILHTNDTHSAIDPNDNGMGGILPRKLLIDSVRRAEKNVILIDAGDVVQGSLYFKKFRGEVEFPLLNMLGYDYIILGNHEFDNGVDALAQHYKYVKAKKLATNYDLSATALDGMFQPYDIRKVDGKKIGFFSVNLDPDELITDANRRGVVYRDATSEANCMAAFLKNEKQCDLVVAITHIGYTSNEKTDLLDPILASRSKDIDIIIGGHSHTYIDPSQPERYLVKNADGREVLVVQTGTEGTYLGYINIDLDHIGNVRDYDYREIPVMDRADKSVYDRKIMQYIAPYKRQVDSLNRVAVGWTDSAMVRKGQIQTNWTADFARQYGQWKTDSLINVGVTGLMPHVDLAIMNRGGLRKPIPAGTVYEGRLMDVFPFSNRIVLMQIQGRDLERALKACAEKVGYESISNEVRVVLDNDGSVLNILIDGVPLDSDRIYNICTIDYLSWGKDGMDALKSGTVVWSDDVEMSVPVVRYVRHLTELGLPMDNDTRPRFVKAIQL